MNVIEKTISVYHASDAETIVNEIEAIDTDTHGEAVAEFSKSVHRVGSDR